MNSARKRTVLIAGASIAGPTLAYWLSRYGFEVTVVEKSNTFRAGGHAVDLRGPALDIANKMGILDIARSYHVDVSKVTFIDEQGGLVGTLNTADVANETGEDVEIPRGDLVNALIKATGDAVEWIFSDSIVGLDNRENDVEVTFDSGTKRVFDLVIGADGTRSRTRRLAIDPDDTAVKYLGYCFALYAMPNFLGIKGENRSWNIGGKMAVMLPTDNDAEIHGMLAFLAPTPPAEIYGDDKQAREFIAAHFEGYGWEIPTMVELLHSSDDVYFDSANYVDSPTWSKGRVALVGDAGYCPSLFTGRGSGLAVIGAYILASELAKNEDHVKAFAEYERILRPFVVATQATVPGMIFQLAPRTDEDLAARNAVILNPALMAGHEHEAPPSITLPDYSDLATV